MLRIVPLRHQAGPSDERDRSALEKAVFPPSLASFSCEVYASLLALPSLLFNHISQLSFIPPLLIIFVLLWRLRLMSSLLSLSFMVPQLLVNYFCFRLWLLRLKVSWICNYKPYIYLCYVGLYDLSKLSNPGKALVRCRSARSRLAESQFALNRRNSSSFSSQCTPE